MQARDDLIFSSDENSDNPDKKNPKTKSKTANPKKKKTKPEPTNRTLNVRSVGFKDFLLKPELMKGIGDAGFEHPSEVQQEAIPLASYGQDLICQAKSGMGKTAVFVLSILHQLDVDAGKFQCLVLCHTRELAHQICMEFRRLGKYITGLVIQDVYGGVSIDNQILKMTSRPPHIIIGTPGRTLHLIKKDVLKVDGLKYFIIDECDQVLEKIDMRAQVQEIFVKTKPKKQVCMYTATLSEKTMDICMKFLKKV